MKSKKHIFAEISKVEAKEDGTLIVSGYASSAAEDSDGETITTDAMRAALPDYMKFGAVREMHQASAAGTALEASIEESTGKTLFSAHVVDPVAVLKVNTGVYKGFSIGGKVTERDSMNKKIIKGLKLVEVSLVDRPANPEAVFTLGKAENTPEDDVIELAELLDDGAVTPAQVLALIKQAKEVPAAAEVVVPVVPAEPVVAKSDAPAPAAADTVQKGMYSLSDFACLLSSIAYLASDAEWESQYEGDNSPLPQALRDWLKTGVGIFNAMAAEETEELIAGLNTAAGVVDVIQMAEGKLTIQKAGAKFAASTKEALGDIHKGMLTLCDKMDGLGYKDAEADKAATGDDLQKVAGDLDLAKAEITKLSDSLAKAEARVKELEALPAPGKALLKAISKGDDIVPTDNKTDVTPVKKADGTVDDVSTLIKSAHAKGGQVLRV